jgi:hypothetical protein
MENLNSIDLGELIAIGSIAAGGVTAWINARINIARLQTELDFIKNEVKEEKENNAKSFEKIESKLDILLEKITELRVKR